LLKVTTGVLLTINFVIFWMLPIGLQGQFWKLVLHYPLRPIYLWLDNHPAIREFAVKHVYRREVSPSSFFSPSVFFCDRCILRLDNFPILWGEAFTQSEEPQTRVKSLLTSFLLSSP
jgi:hypothetical protein